MHYLQAQKSEIYKARKRSVLLGTWNEQQQTVYFHSHQPIRSAVAGGVEINDRLMNDMRVTTQFLKGWLERFKKRWSLKAFGLHSGEEDVDLPNSVMATDKVRAKTETYFLKDVFGC